MSITRRHILVLSRTSLLTRVFAATLPESARRTTFDVDRLLNANDGDYRIDIRQYVASATVTLFSIPLVSKSCVGSGFAVIEEAGHTLSIQFGAGSYPESARGLNRLGFIQEAVIEERPGCPAECAWLAFMTTSQEQSLDQARKTVEPSEVPSGKVIPYSASQGHGQDGSFSSRVDRLEFPGRYTWRDLTQLVARAREAMAAGEGDKREVTPSGTERPATFLYSVRRAMLDPRSRTTASLVFNGKQFQLDTQKEKDTEATTHFAGRTLIPSSGCVMRLNATLTEKRTGEKTPFRLWYGAGEEEKPPLRFEYQAKPFLRLVFEADAKADTPPIPFAFKTSKEDA
jgi:hypothetical protein